MDISADLTELGRTPVAVVSAGVKSILDIGKTLEYLVSAKPEHVSVSSINSVEVLNFNVLYRNLFLQIIRIVKLTCS